MTPPIRPDVTAVQTVASSVPPIGPAPQEVKFSPYQGFLYRQAMRIVARGGSLGDVADYFKHAEQHNIRVSVGPHMPPVGTEATNMATDLHPEMPGMIRGLAQQTLQGVTFGFGDEALGTLYGLLSGEGDQAGRDQYRGELALFHGAHPTASNIASLAGSAVLPGGLGGKLLGVGGKWAAGAVGAGAAGLQAAGDTQGADLTDRAKAALMAAPFGMIFGAVFPTAAKYAGQTVVHGAEKLPGFAKLMAKVPGSPQYAARELLQEALNRDGIAGSAAASKAEQRAGLGLPTTVADVGGEHTLALANVAKQFQSPEQQALVGNLMQRNADTGARLLAAIGTGSRLGLQNAYELADQLMAQRSTQADPLYKQAFGQMVNLTAPLRKFLATPIFQEAYATGRATAMAEDAAKLGRGLAVPELPADLKDIAQLPVRALDYMKRGLDFMIERAGKEGRPPLSRQTATALRERLNGMLDQVSKKVPVYQQARDAWRGFSEQLDALQLGADGFLQKAPEVIQREIAASTAPEMYRIGAIQTLSNVVHGVGSENSNVAQRFFGASLFGTEERTMAARIRNLFADPTAADDFMDRLAGEAASVRAMQRLGGNKAPNAAAGTEALNPAGRTQRILEKTGVSSAADRQPRARAIANEITMLFAKGLDDPNELVAMLHTLDRLHRFTTPVTAALRTTAGELGQQAQQQ